MSDSSEHAEVGVESSADVDDSADDVTGHGLLDVGGAVLPAPGPVVADSVTKTRPGAGKAHFEPFQITKNID